MVPPDDSDMVARFLKDDTFLLVSPNSYNSLGLGLTQLYNTTWVYNHKRHGELKLNGKNFLFKLKSGFPETLSTEFLVVDLLDSLDELAEDSDKVVESFKKNITRFDINELIKMSVNFGSGTTRKLILQTLRNKRLIYA
jgi:hypothetical protein